MPTLRKPEQRLRKPEQRKAAFKAVDLSALAGGTDRRIPLIILAAIAAIMAIALILTQCTGQKAPSGNAGSSETVAVTADGEPTEEGEGALQEEYDVEEPENPAARDSLSEYSWEELSAISEKISLASTEEDAIYIAKQYRLVSPSGKLDGNATKSVSLSNGTSAEVRIIGFNHDSASDGTGRAGITFMFADGIGSMSFNEDGSNAGGWPSSSASYYLGVDFWSQLPEELTAVIKEVSKSSNTAEEGNVAETGDIMWLPSYIELVGTVDPELQNVASTLQQEGTQYQLFADAGVSASANNSLLVMHEGSQASAWWLRTADVAHEGAVCYVNAAGRPSDNGAASEEYLLVPCFCI